MQTNFRHPQQIKFGEIVQLIIQHEDLAKQSFKESEDLFQSLLKKAFKGELNNQPGRNRNVLVARILANQVKAKKFIKY
jgi:hypothetical protein